MSGVIYLVQDDQRLLEMVETPYASESLLQGLVADYPHLLAGDQIDASAPRRWLLVSREVGLAADENGANRWAVDHVFLDQDGIPTIVEVKRSTDSRIRREVVGQMLEYAAHAVVHWSADSLRAQFEAACAAQGSEPEQVLGDFLGPDTNADTFWANVKTNLQAGRVRLLFVADKIPPELQRIVEFLSAQMDPAEVLAIEIQQFVGQGIRALVPRVVGHRPGRHSTGTQQSRQWDAASFTAALATSRGSQEVVVFRRILDWVRERGLHLWWGKGVTQGSCYPMLDYQGDSYWTFAVWTGGSVSIQFGMLQAKPPFDDEAKRRELLDRLNRIPGVNISEERLAKYPSFPLRVLTDSAALDQFLAAFDWVVEEIRRTREVTESVEA